MNDDYLRVVTADGRKFDLPVKVTVSDLVIFGDEPKVTSFTADQPVCERDLNITEVRLFSDEIDCVARFILGSITLLATEAGRWTVSVVEDRSGARRYELEYYATERFGERIYNLAIAQWDHEMEHML